MSQRRGISWFSLSSRCQCLASAVKCSTIARLRNLSVSRWCMNSCVESKPRINELRNGVWRRFVGYVLERLLGQRWLTLKIYCKSSGTLDPSTGKYVISCLPVDITQVSLLDATALFRTGARMHSAFVGQAGTFVQMTTFTLTELHTLFGRIVTFLQELKDETESN